METKRIEEISILGDVSKYYQTKTQEGGGILDEPHSGKIEMYPAGYTKPSNRDNRPRQSVYQALWETAVSQSKESELYPFGIEGHNVEIIHDPNNPHDKNALHLILRVGENSKLPRTLDGADLGFIPKKINQQILKKVDEIHGGRILKVKANFHGKYWGAKVVLGYGNTTFNALAPTELGRFRGIMDE